MDKYETSPLKTRITYFGLVPKKSMLGAKQDSKWWGRFPQMKHPVFSYHFRRWGHREQNLGNILIGKLASMERGSSKVPLAPSHYDLKGKIQILNFAHSRQLAQIFQLQE